MRFNEAAGLIVPLLFVGLVVGCCLVLVDIVEITTVSEEEQEN